ncbi:ABC transporter substrate-binding protein [Enemella sp. A6]|uniref:ABC transporter substrate-binding protein n=1 Tax=Enemella sp. A6 TaxID=3440152 RepID=UPI003EB956F8
MIKNMRKLAVAGIGAALLLTACGGGGDDGNSGGGDGGAPEKAEITVGVLPLADYSTVYWAQENGFFEKEGLTVTLEPVQGGPVGAQKVATGELDFSISNTFTTATATQSGMPVKTVVLGSALGDNSIGMYVKPDSAIKGIEDLDGKTIGINTTSNVGDVTFRALAKEKGIEVNPTFVEVPFPEMLTGVQSDSIDVGYAPEPFLSAARNADMRQVVDLTEGPNNKLAVSNFVAGDNFLNKNPNTAAAFARAMYAANKDILSKEKEWREWLPTVTKVPADTALEMPMPTFITETDVAEIQRVADMMMDQGILESGYEAEQFTWTE